MKGREQLWMLLRCVSFVTDEKRNFEGSLHPKTQDPARAGIEKRIDGADVAKSGKLEEDINWPQLREDNAMLQIPSFEKAGPSVSHGGSTFQRNGCPKNLSARKGPS